MKSAELPKNENERLKLLNDLAILDSLEEQAFDDLTKLASYICDCPISLVSLVDKDRQWFKSHHGLGARETPREFAFCAHAIHDDKTFYIPDSEKDERFFDNPLVTDDPKVKFYAGFPLTLRKNLRVGTLCVIDNKPRELSEAQIEALEAIGRQVVSQLELRLRVKEREALDRMKSEFVAMVSHELRTPLTSIYGSLAILDSGALENMEEMKELISVSHRSSERLIRIVNDILDLTRIESNNFSLEKTENKVSESLLKLQDEVGSYFSQCNVTLAIQNTYKDDTALYDEVRFLQIFRNLLSNAAKFSPAGSEVVLQVEADADHVLFSVIDKGRGIPEENKADIFSKFSKMSGKNDEKLPGTGLGLNIVQQLVNTHGGEISFESESGKGSTFFVKLPK